MKWDRTQAEPVAGVSLWEIQLGSYLGGLQEPGEALESQKPCVCLALEGGWLF